MQESREEAVNDEGCLTLNGYLAGRPTSLRSEPTSAKLSVAPRRRDNLTDPHPHKTMKKKKKKKNTKKVNQYIQFTVYYFWLTVRN